MGLHICYELALPPETTRNRVLELLAELRLEAMRGTFERVTEIRELHAAECEFRPENDTFDLWALFKISARKRVVTSPEEDHDALVPPEYAAGFMVVLGRRSEPAAFGFSQGPEFVRRKEESPPLRQPGWHWHYCCKTQYASVVSDEHLLRCHLGLIDLLDSASKLGIQVTVRDEAGYYEHRDPKRLLDRVHEENRLIARFVGRLAEKLDSDSTRTQSPIFEHPRFEHLEGEG